MLCGALLAWRCGFDFGVYGLMDGWYFGISYLLDVLWCGCAVVLLLVRVDVGCLPLWFIGLLCMVALIDSVLLGTDVIALVGWLLFCLCACICAGV